MAPVLFLSNLFDTVAVLAEFREFLLLDYNFGRTTEKISKHT